LKVLKEQWLFFNPPVHDLIAFDVTAVVFALCHLAAESQTIGKLGWGHGSGS
jgi:hypothetical protein